MKLLTFGVAALCCFAFGGLVSAQTQTVTVDTFRNAGAEYYKAGKFTQAVKAYEQVIRMSPDDAAAYSQLGESYRHLNMNKEAAAAFEKSAALNEKEADRLISGKAAPARVVASPPQNTPARVPPAAPAANNTGRRYKVGDRVEFISDAKWFKAIILQVANNDEIAPYHVYLVHSLGFSQTDDTWVGDYTDNRAQLRAAGSGPTVAVPGGEANDVVLSAMRGAAGVPPAAGNGGAIALGKYVCTTNANAILVHVGGFTLQAGGAYTDEANVRGSYIYDANQRQITFKGAGMNGQSAKYDPLRRLFTVQVENRGMDCGPGN